MFPAIQDIELLLDRERQGGRLSLGSEMIHCKLREVPSAKKQRFDAGKRMSDAGDTLPSLPIAVFYYEPDHNSLGQRRHQDHSRQHLQPLLDQAYLLDGTRDRMKVMDKAAI